MPETLTGTLLLDIERWLKKVEELEESGSGGRLRLSALNLLVEATQAMMDTLRVNPERWMEVAEFVRQQSGRYKSRAIHGLFEILEECYKLLEVK